MKIGIIVLAAGNSSRMKGEPKQLLEFEGKSFLRRASETALATRCRPVVVVLGANAEKLQSEIENLPLAIEINENWASGLGASIKTGLLKSLEIEPDLSAVVLTLADQPLVTAPLLERLIEIYWTAQKSIVAAEYENTFGVPALFSRSTFAELLEMPDAAGAKNVLEKNAEYVEKISAPEAAFDVDSIGDYDRLLKLKSAATNRASDN